jgi:hypothetical protein
VNALIDLLSPPAVSEPQPKRSTDLKGLIVAVLLNAALVGVFLLLATPYYETNDDLDMQFIASGFYTGHPSEYLVFTSVLIGWPLRILYSLWTGHNWYLAYLLATHYLALTAFAFLIFSRRLDRLFVLLYVGFFLFVEIRILLRPQFTTTAFLVGMAGLLLLVDGLSLPQPPRWGRVIAGFALVSLMFLIREPVAPMLMVVAAPFLVERFGLSGWRRLFGVGVFCALLFVALQGINQWFYRHDPAWGEFEQYNNLRGQIHGTLLGRLVERTAPTVGWNENDAKMFLQSYFPDQDTYASLDKMRTLHANLQQAAKSEPFLRNFSGLYLFLPKLLGRDAGLVMWLAILNAAWCLFFAGNQRARFLITLAGTYLVLVILSFYMRETARLPARVTYNMPLFLNAMCFYWASGFSPTLYADSNNFFRNCLATLRRVGLMRLPLGGALVPWVAAYVYLVSEVGQNMWWHNSLHRNLSVVSQAVQRPIETLRPGGKKPTVVVLPFNTVLEQSPFFRPAGMEAPCFFVPYGWLTHSPIFDQILDQHQLYPYSTSVLDRPDVFFLMDTRWLEPLQKFYFDHYALNVRFDLVLNTDNSADYRNCQLHLYQGHVVDLNKASAVVP